jgi:hypothetical protein
MGGLGMAYGQDKNNGLGSGLLIFMVIMMVVALAVSFKRGDIKSPSCRGYSERVKK